VRFAAAMNIGCWHDDKQRAEMLLLKYALELAGWCGQIPLQSGVPLNSTANPVVWVNWLSTVFTAGIEFRATSRKCLLPLISSFVSS
jgi:hypothetical protein